MAPAPAAAIAIAVPLPPTPPLPPHLRRRHPRRGAASLAATAAGPTAALAAGCSALPPGLA